MPENNPVGTIQPNFIYNVTTGDTINFTHKKTLDITHLYNSQIGIIFDDTSKFDTDGEITFNNTFLVQLWDDKGKIIFSKLISINNDLMKSDEINNPICLKIEGIKIVLLEVTL